MPQKMEKKSSRWKDYKITSLKNINIFEKNNLTENNNSNNN